MDGKVPVATDSPWHEGELALQRRAGAAERMDVVGRRVLRDHLIEQHRDFYPLLPFIVVGAADHAGEMWATILAGRPGFLHSPEPRTLHVAAGADPADPLASGLEDGAAIGLLGIELHTRRRNRLNGTVRRTGPDAFDVEVGESFGNCPRYIRLRDFGFARDPAAASTLPVRRFDRIEGPAAALIAGAETLFIASSVTRADGRRQVDVSHRGGRPGFVAVQDDGSLLMPDFAGNLFFNTLGNILADPRCGFTFVDFETGDLLQLSGDGEVILEGPEIAAFEGAEQLLRFRPKQILLRPGALPLRWHSPADGASPHSLATGNWEEARALLETGFRQP
ncbi:pyridoxamine 5'-phosphate oxidase family protein [Labrys sp. LIt4]|uniref:pyridoxamine 5'-phosphate oxidase family protein n=1 Tax=Labrys sp. LIt4 TaxID=2821355 RepID=UPI001FD82614|nr:pyridoxamine 5'-phosphate oxidase family protein [Labrys sp. LIt4]